MAITEEQAADMNTAGHQLGLLDKHLLTLVQTASMGYEGDTFTPEFGQEIGKALGDEVRATVADMANARKRLMGGT